MPTRLVVHLAPWASLSPLVLFALSVLSFAGAALLAVTLPSTWPLLVARVAFISLGIALLVLGLRERRQRTRSS
jgi:hypothetical protein